LNNRDEQDIQDKNQEQLVDKLQLFILIILNIPVKKNLVFSVTL